MGPWHDGFKGDSRLSAYRILWCGRRCRNAEKKPSMLLFPLAFLEAAMSARTAAAPAAPARAAAKATKTAEAARTAAETPLNTESVHNKKAPLYKAAPSSRWKHMMIWVIYCGSL